MFNPQNRGALKKKAFEAMYQLQLIHKFLGSMAPVLDALHPLQLRQSLRAFLPAFPCIQDSGYDREGG